jgi:hypothetical protein
VKPFGYRICQRVCTCFQIKLVIIFPFHLFTIHKSNTQSQRQIGCGFGQEETYTLHIIKYINTINASIKIGQQSNIVVIPIYIKYDKVY